MDLEEAIDFKRLSSFTKFLRQHRINAVASGNDILIPLDGKRSVKIAIDDIKLIASGV